MKLTLASKRSQMAFCLQKITGQLLCPQIKRTETEKDGHFFAFLQE
jgi:hypothetical protein